MPPRGPAQGQSPADALRNAPPNASPPPSFAYPAFDKFSTMDTQHDRHGMPPDHLSWCENAIIVGPNNIQSVPGPGSSITNIAGKTVSFTKEAYLNSVHYLFVFTTDGSGYQVLIATSSTVQFASPGTFSNPDLTTYNSQRILIADPTAGYCTWDTVVFVKQGGCSPNISVTNGGSSYSAAPTVTITGGHGSATAISTIANGSVTAVILQTTNFAYQVGDTLTVTFSGGGGSSAAAKAFVWPFLGFTSTSLDVFEGAVWISGYGTPVSIGGGAGTQTGTQVARILLWTGTTDQGAITNIGYDNITSAGGAGFVTITDSDLVEGITALRAVEATGLVIIGSNSVKAIASSSVSGSPPVRQFTIQPVSSNYGTVWRNSIVAFDQYVVFANPTGCYAIVGNSVGKISDALDGLFQAVNPIPNPQGAIVDILAKHYYALLVNYTDPVLGVRPLLLLFGIPSTLSPESTTASGATWQVASQGSLLAIASVATKSAYLLYGSSGSDITPLFAAPANAVQIKIQFAMVHGGAPFVSKHVLQAVLSYTSNGAGTVNLSCDTEVSSQTVSVPTQNQVNFTSMFGQVNFQSANGPVNFAGTGFAFQPINVQGAGVYVGFTITGLVSGFSMTSLVAQAQPMLTMRSL